jgi:hypothetical protein
VCTYSLDSVFFLNGLDSGVSASFFQVANNCAGGEIGGLAAGQRTYESVDKATSPQGSIDDERNLGLAV